MSLRTYALYGRNMLLLICLLVLLGGQVGIMSVLVRTGQREPWSNEWLHSLITFSGMPFPRGVVGKSVIPLDTLVADLAFLTSIGCALMGKHAYLGITCFRFFHVPVFIVFSCILAMSSCAGYSYIRAHTAQDSTTSRERSWKHARILFCYSGTMSLKQCFPQATSSHIERRHYVLCRNLRRQFTQRSFVPCGSVDVVDWVLGCWCDLYQSAPEDLKVIGGT